MKKPITRRSFISKTASFCGVSIISNIAMGQSMVDENDPQAKALGYKIDGTRVNVNKYPTYAASQRCGTCALFLGKAGDSSGKCPLFAGGQVSAFGWCAAYARNGGLPPEVSKPKAEATKPQSIENQNGLNSQSSITTKAQADASERLSLEVSKQKCEELGFKPATEGFGKCVLQLTK